MNYFTKCMVVAGTFFLFFCFTGLSQQKDNPNLLSKPKDIAYDTLKKVCYISNFQGNSIVKMDSLGNQELMLDGLNKPMGLLLCGDTLIISSNSPSKITAIDIDTYDILYELDVSQGEYLSMMTRDMETGLIYIVEQLGAVYVLNNQIQECHLFVPQGVGIPYGSQSIEIDPTNQQLLVFQWDPGYITSISISDSTQITATLPQYISKIQGTVEGPEGEIYATSYSNNGIFKYEPGPSGPVTELVSGLLQPSGLTYNPHHHSLYVCIYGANAIEEILLSPISINEHHCSKQEFLIYPNPAKNMINMQLNLTNAIQGSAKIMDMSGNLVMEKEVILPPGRHTIPMDIVHLKQGKPINSGHYLVLLYNHKKLVASTKMVVVQ
jgi:DNA-binding beta-propeller fold protein YncE